MSDTPSVPCWRCGQILPVALFPLRREEVCPACDADVHVCKQCRFFNASVSDGCDEPVAGGVSNKERANFCDYLVPSTTAYRGGSALDGGTARAKLEALFGDADDTSPAQTDEGDTGRAELDRLFGLRDD